MARFRKKALSKMSVWELSTLMDKLTNERNELDVQRHALDVQLSEVIGYIRDSEIAAQVHLRHAKDTTGLDPYQYQNLEQFA